MAINPESLKKATGAYFDELKYVMARIPDFPALVELITRLTGKDRKTCELALYTLKKQDERLAKKDRRIAELEKIVSMADEDAAMMLAKKDARISELKAALQIYADARCQGMICAFDDGEAARAALEKKNG